MSASSALKGSNIIQKANRKLKSLGLDGSIKSSTKENKKLVLIRNDKPPIHFGYKGSSTFLEGASEDKRKAYRARHKEIYLKDGSKAINKKYSPAYLSYNILW